MYIKSMFSTRPGDGNKPSYRASDFPFSPETEAELGG